MDRLLSFSPEPFELHFEFEGTLQMPIAPKCGYCGGELQCRQCNNHSTYFRRASHVLGVTDAPLEFELETGPRTPPVASFASRPASSGSTWSTFQGPKRGQPWPESC